jgi:phospholipase C
MPADLRTLAAAVTVAFGIAACSGLSTSATTGALPQQLSPPESTSGSGYLKHVVLVIQENRTFDNLFATFPGADGTTHGCMKPVSAAIIVGHVRPVSHAVCPRGDLNVALKEVDLPEKCDFGHSYFNVAIDYDGSLMDGFGFEGGSKACPGKVGKAVYQYVDPRQIAPYWDLAKRWVLADQMFQTQGSGSFTAHQDLIAGSTLINRPQDTKSLVDYPSRMPWGCDAPSGTKTTLLVYTVSKLKHEYHKGPFPCMTYETLRDLLDAKSVSWKYYTPPEPDGTGALWNAFDAIEAVREGPQWNTNIAPTNAFFTDVSSGTLPAVSWIVPDDVNSDHPGPEHDDGPSWVASIVNAIGVSSYWRTTAIVVVWDDWGGFYDHVPPPFFDRWGGLGFRVPMLVVSPYARETHPGRPGYISHTQYEFGSILKFIEHIWRVGSLGTTDKRATSIVDCFDFTQPPRAFTVIAAKHSKSYFLHQPPSYKPVDSE